MPVEHARHLNRAHICRLQTASYPMLLWKLVSPTIFPASSRTTSWFFLRDELHRIWKPSSAEGQSGIVVQSISSYSRLTLLIPFLVSILLFCSNTRAPFVSRDQQAKASQSLHVYVGDSSSNIQRGGCTPDTAGSPG